MTVEHDQHGCCTSGTRLSPDAARLHHPADLAGAAVRSVREMKTVPALVGIATTHGVSPPRDPAALSAPTHRLACGHVRNTSTQPTASGARATWLWSLCPGASDVEPFERTTPEVDATGSVGGL